MAEPAFPINEGNFYRGMDLRDYFAAKAMEAMILFNTDPIDSRAYIVENAYALADAMMKEREKTND